MSRLIYQYWSGEMPIYAQVSKDLFTTYAEKCGAEYRFDQDPQFFKSKYSQYYNALRPIFDPAFHHYDQVLFVDMDVVPVLGLDADIFATTRAQIAMVQEVDQPQLRSNMRGNITTKNDLRWAKVVNFFWGVQVPLDPLGRPRVYNSGVVLYSKSGLNFARKAFASVKTYQYLMTLVALPRFYRLDQNYLGAFVGRTGCDFSELSADWNSQVTSISTADGKGLIMDTRTSSSKFIHMQHAKGIKNNMTRADVLSVAAGTYRF